MEFNMQIKLESDQVKEIICNYLKQNSGFEKINPKNLNFLVRTVEMGSIREFVFDGVTVNNVKIGKGKFE